MGTLYQKYHLERADERISMFKILNENAHIKRALYPGSFVHLTPSLVFPDVTYVDNDKRAKRFFSGPESQQLIAQRKIYPQEAQVQFYHQDYAQELPESDQSFDLLISQYAGFISQACKHYLTIGGWLIANNSHGDASMADLDDDYELVAILNRRGETFQFSTKNLDEYFIPKKDVPVTRAYLEEIQRGIGYRKSAFGYLFKRV